VSQPEISPLARRLAEENNVDWRGLHGSGAGGKVVERDVLEFLARVMAGEEDVDPTPEPVPEGMEAWPEADVRTFQEEVRASRKDVGLDEIQQELSAADRMAGGAIDLDDEPVMAGEDEADSDSDEISEDIFLFGEDGKDEGDELGLAASGVADVPAEEPSLQAGFADYEDDEDELLVAGEDGLGEDVPEAPSEPADEEAFEIGAQATGGAELPDVFGGEAEAEDDAWRGAGAALFADEEPDGGGDLEVPPLGDVDDGGVFANDLSEAEHGEPVAPGAAPQGAPFADAGAAAWDVTASDEEATFDTGAAPQADEPEAWGEVDRGRSFAEAPIEPDQAVPAAAEGAGPSEPEPRPVAPVDIAGVPAEGPAFAAEAPGPQVPAELPLVSYGTLLRRHVDVSALAGAQLAIGLELGEGEPLSPAPFLLRAAAKAVADGAWGEGTVAMVALDDDGAVRLRRFGDVVRMPFLELVGALGRDDEGLSGADEAVALSVVDMSALDVDEAVLSVGGPLLTLGRILYDNQRGSYRSTLSLAGEVPAERGARLLARVAELLDAPVRLLL
jgi:resuscitation-promoting factor RpfA